MKQVPLSGPRSEGRFALVDDDDFALVMDWKWGLVDYYIGTEYATAYGNGALGLLLHHVIMGKPPAPGLLIDHVNGNGLDNRRSNLRWATHQQNMWNSKGHRNSSSAYKGVVKTSSKKNPWTAQIVNDGKYHYLGCFPSEGEAAKAYDEAAARMRGEFAWLNFPAEKTEKLLDCS